jgi:hypothetical protein
MAFYEKTLQAIKADPKMSILKQTKGKKAMEGMKYILFGNNIKSADAWESQFSGKEIQTAKLIVISRLKRTQKEIIIQLILETPDTEAVIIGERMSYKKGMKFIQDFF